MQAGHRAAKAPYPERRRGYQLGRQHAPSRYRERRFGSAFGFTHGAAGIGTGQSPTVAVSYLAVAGLLFYCSRYAVFHPIAMGMHEVAAEAD